MKRTAAEWVADRERRSLPHYGGNRIPASYLRRFGTYVEGPEPALPDNISEFVRSQL